MKILILSTFEGYGGAATAAKRLYEALLKSGAKVKFGYVIGDKPRSMIGSFWSRLLFRLCFIGERIHVLLSVRKRAYLYRFSTASAGLNLLANPLVREADIIHLHWVNFGFLSIRQIEKLARSKPLVWTLHDMWAFTGGCHYALGCTAFRHDCTDCFYMSGFGKNLPKRVLMQKAERWGEQHLNIVGVSRWMSAQAAASTLLKHCEITTIGNPIDTDVFKPRNKASERRESVPDSPLVILSGAMDFGDERKGFRYLSEAIEKLHAEGVAFEWLTFGKSNPRLKHSTRFGVTELGEIKDIGRLAEVYQAADLFVLPSVQDNLPNTAMEAAACGLPVVAFASGGITDLVEHKKTGYIAQQFTGEALAEGIKYFLSPDIRKKAGQEARTSMLKHYAEEVIADRYIRYYQRLIPTDD